jgi:hypothetical protein
MPKKWSVLIIVFIFILIASFMGWRDEHHALMALQDRLKSPEFAGGIGEVSCGKTDKGVNICFISGAITNPVGPQSGVMDWKVSLNFQEDRIIDGEIPLTTGEDMIGTFKKGTGGMKYLANDYWPKKGTQPIPSGGACVGWIMASFGKFDWYEALENKKATLVLEFNDIVANKKHKFEFAMEGYKEPEIPPAYR